MPDEIILLLGWLLIQSRNLLHAGALQLVQVCPHHRLISSRDPELLAICEALFVILYLGPSQFRFGFAAVRASHTFFSFLRLQELNTRKLGLFLLGLLLLALVLAVGEKDSCWVQ